MDSYAEYLVAKRNTGTDSFKKMLLLTGGGIITLLFLVLALFYMPLLLFVACAAGWGTWWLFTNQYVEYEYLLTNGELDIDKIIGKRRRQRMLTVKISSFSAFGEEAVMDDTADAVTTVLVAGEGKSTYCADFQDDSLGAVRLVFSPDEHMLDTITPYLRGGARH